MHYPFLSILLRRRIQLNVPRSKVNAPPPWSIEKLSKNCPKCRWQMRTNRPPPNREEELSSNERGQLLSEVFHSSSFFIASIVNDARQFFMITREAVLDFQRKTLSHLSTGLLSLVRVKKERGCVPIN